MSGASVESLLQVLSFAGCLTAMVRLFQLRLAKSHPFLLCYLAITLTIQFVVVRFGDCSLFCHAYLRLEPLRDIICVLAVAELFAAAFRQHAGRVIALAAGLAPIGLSLTLAAPTSRLVTKAVFRVIRFERGITFALAISLVVLLYSVWKRRVRLPRNEVVLGVFFALWFLANSALLMAVSFLPAGYLNVMNEGLAVFEIGCYIGWTVMLSKPSDLQYPSVRHAGSPASA